uniref:Uncharacterized protein n=1 Tax=Setaria viridis TaxID=4556 RepID=A0A4U6TMQ8_SETVI|nr:hypothetical protein SEVIR_8G249801v2 [Setaria viridis]
MDQSYLLSFMFIHSNFHSQQMQEQGPVCSYNYRSLVKGRFSTLGTSWLLHRF